MQSALVAGVHFEQPVQLFPWQVSHCSLACHGAFCAIIEGYRKAPEQDIQEALVKGWKEQQRKYIFLQQTDNKRHLGLAHAAVM